MDIRFLGFVFAAVALGASCSLLIDNKADQCTTDLDCEAFSGAVCDLSTHLCKMPLGRDAGSGSDAAAAEAGCALATTFYNACSNATCIKFDNRTRLKRLPPDGGLTPLPPARETPDKADAATNDGGTPSDAKSEAPVPVSDGGQEN